MILTAQNGLPILQLNFSKITLKKFTEVESVYSKLIKLRQQLSEKHRKAKQTLDKILGI
jgi:hypothetical protein